MSITPQEALQRTIEHREIFYDEMLALIRQIMAGEISPVMTAAILTGLRVKKETIGEITAAATVMRELSTKVHVPPPHEHFVDIVGTGGDGAHTFNISTAAAFVLAGTGRKVAKHGNRAASSQCGSADVLSALGVNLDLTPDQVAAAIEQVGIGFMFAPKFHPAMKYAVGPRKEMGQRTIFNVLGPLTNPAGARIQLTGVYDAKLTEPLAHVLKELGSQAALIIHGANGLDELNPTGVNRVSHLRNGNVETYDLNPADLGLAPCTVADLRGGTPDESAQMMRDILSNKLTGARRDAVLLNTAAALAAETGDFKSALAEATVSLDSGAALNKLNALIEFTKSA